MHSRFAARACRLTATADGVTFSLSNGVAFTRSLVRDAFRRSLVTGIANSVGGNLVYSYDALSRPVSRNADAFDYNERSEVSAALVAGNSAEYDYDYIGNETSWTANCLNQYTEFPHDDDGNLLSDGVFSFAYDSANRLKTVSSNGVLLVTNFYDAKSRRVKKVTPSATTTFFYDDWNLIEERNAYVNGETSTIRYFWGKDLSGTMQGAGGVGGLLFLTVDGVPYVPFYDNNGNVMRYCGSNGSVVAEYAYDAFGKTIAKSGPLAHVFRHRFSTKYYDTETGLYYYGYRFYHPSIMRWLNRDPIEEAGGRNLYGFISNAPVIGIDALGRKGLTLRYDFAQDTNFLERLVNWPTPSRISVNEAIADIKNRVKPYNKSGRGKCNCIKKIVLAGHGSEGVAGFGEDGVNSLAGSYFKGSRDVPSFPRDVFSLLDTVKSLSCDKMTVEFATCESGLGKLGEDLRSELTNFFGGNVTVVLYDVRVKPMFNIVFREPSIFRKFREQSK